jgi:hypothetical protein
MGFLKCFIVILSTLGEGYFDQEKTISCLPDPTGPLSFVLPSSSVVTHVSQAVGQKIDGRIL